MPPGPAGSNSHSRHWRRGSTGSEQGMSDEHDEHDDSNASSVTADVLDGDEYGHTLDEKDDDGSLTERTRRLRLARAALFNPDYRIDDARARTSSANDKTPTARCFEPAALRPPHPERSALSAVSTNEQPDHMHLYGSLEAGPSSPTVLPSPWDAPKFSHSHAIDEWRHGQQGSQPDDDLDMSQSHLHHVRSKSRPSLLASSNSVTSTSDRIVKHSRRRSLHRADHSHATHINEQTTAAANKNIVRQVGRKSARLSGSFSIPPINTSLSSDTEDGIHQQQSPHMNAKSASQSSSPTFLRSVGRSRNGHDSQYDGHVGSTTSSSGPSRRSSWRMEASYGPNDAPSLEGSDKVRLNAQSRIQHAAIDSMQQKRHSPADVMSQHSQLLASRLSDLQTDYDGGESAASSAPDVCPPAQLPGSSAKAHETHVNGDDARPLAADGISPLLSAKDRSSRSLSSDANSPQMPTYPYEMMSSAERLTSSLSSRSSLAPSANGLARSLSNRSSEQSYSDTGQEFISRAALPMSPKSSEAYKSTVNGDAFAPRSPSFAGPSRSGSLRRRSSTGHKRDVKRNLHSPVQSRSRSGSLRSSSKKTFATHNASNSDNGLRQDMQSDSQVAYAQAVNPIALASMIKDARRAPSKNQKLLLLDLRPLHVYAESVQPPSAGCRVRSSINVNFPSLLIKRLKKGSVTSFTLESFITTQFGHDLYRSMSASHADILSTAIPGVDVCILDEHLSSSDFQNVSTTSSIGAVLVSILQRRRSELVASQHASTAPMTSDDRTSHEGRLLYLDGSMQSLLKALSDLDSSLLASGPDDDDRYSPTTTLRSSQSLNIIPPSSSFQSDHLPTPTLSSLKQTPPESTSELSQAKKRGRSLPQLNLASQAPTSTLQGSHHQPSLPEMPFSPSCAPTRYTAPPLAAGSPIKKAKPKLLAKLDTSDAIKHPVRPNVPSLNLPNPAKLESARPVSRAPTPIRTTFGALSVKPRNPAYSTDEDEPKPPPTPGFSRSSFGLRDSNPATRNNVALQNDQYPSDPQPGAGPSVFGNGNGGQMTSNPAAPATFDVSVIIPGFLYLGPELARDTDVKDLEALGIKRVLNMAIECDTQQRWAGRFEKIACIPMRDSLAEVHVQERIREACVLLDDADLHSKPTYVHCKAGKSRSVTIVLAFLIHRNHWPLKRAYSYVSERRKGVSPNIGFVAELMRFEESELGSRSQGVLGTGNTPHDSSHGGRNEYFRTHSKTISDASTSSSMSSATGDTDVSSTSPQRSLRNPFSARNTSGNDVQSPGASYIPASLEGRPSIVRHLSLIATTAMNLTADQAASKGVKEAKLASRNARIRESLPPNVSLTGWVTSANTPTSGCTPIGSPSLARG